MVKQAVRAAMPMGWAILYKHAHQPSMTSLLHAMSQKPNKGMSSRLYSNASVMLQWKATDGSYFCMISSGATPTSMWVCSPYYGKHAYPCQNHCVTCGHDLQTQVLLQEVESSYLSWMWLKTGCGDLV